nr:MAG TPA: hypothetical protein [Caudoviricetes sp.]
MNQNARQELCDEVVSLVIQRYTSGLTGTESARDYQVLAQELGELVGRISAVMLTEGPINSDLLMAMRQYEQSGRDRMTQVFREMTAPGGAISQAIAEGIPRKT